MNLVIKNGHLIDPGTSTDQMCHIYIEDGKIKEIIPVNFPLPHIEMAHTEIIDASGLIVSPGFIDIHVHLREPGQEHKETIETGARAAVRGGFTTIASMPNTTPVNDSVQTTQYIIKRAKEINLVNILPVAAISMNLESQKLTPMEELIAAGAVAFSDDGRCVMNETLFKEALKIAKHLHVPLIEHPEDHSISLDGQLNEGEVSARLNVKGIPASSEDRIIERDIQFQEEINSNLHLTHISTTGALKLIADAKKRNIPVTADVTPHHLVLDETFITQPFSAYKMKPPLRTPADRLAMIEGIKNHTIDCIASDHAPHSPEEKAQPFENTPFGIIGLETTFPILHDRLVKQGIIDLKRFIELLSTNPAKIINLQDRGIVKPGVPADLTLFDPDRPFEIKTQDFRSKSVNSPFIGWKGEGAVMYTIVNGKIVYRNDETAGRSHKD